MKIKPAPGRLVRDPATMLVLPPEGIKVPDYDPHWREALRWGDVETVEGEDKPEPVTAQPESKPAGGTAYEFGHPAPVQDLPEEKDPA